MNMQSPVDTEAAFALRSAKGEAPQAGRGRFFRDDQGEVFEPYQKQHRRTDTKVGVLALDDGAWLPWIGGFSVFHQPCASRDEALRLSIARGIRTFRKFKQSGDWDEGFAGRVIEWALSLKPAKEITPLSASDGPFSAESSPEEITDPRVTAVKKFTDAALADPVIAELYAAQKARKIYPPGHVVAMTNPMVNGRQTTTGTCECGQVFQFAWGEHVKMDAAIEAHWQKSETIGSGAAARAVVLPNEVASAATAENKSDGAHPKTDPAAQDPAAPAEPAPALASCEGGAGSSPTVSKGDQLDWDGLLSLAKGAPVDEILCADLIARGFAFVVNPSASKKDFCLTDRGWDRVKELEPLFRPGGPADGSYARSLIETRSRSERLPDADLSYSNAPMEPPRGALSGGGAGSSADEPAAAIEPPPIGGPEDDIAIEWPSYDAFLEGKIVSTPLRGIEVPRGDLHPWLKDFCKDIVVWASRLGCAAIFAECGLHKTAMQIEWVKQMGRRSGGPTLNVVPLGVRHGFIGADGHGGDAGRLDVEMSFIRDASALGIAPRYIERADQMTAGCEHYITNYESIRDGKLDPNLFAAAALDEASVLRSYGSKTFQEFLPLFEKVPFKLVATATPAPNRFKELIHYAAFLGVMDSGQALTRFFQRDSERAGNLTLYAHKVDEFWMWVHSWAAFIQAPSDLGYSDDGYALPPVHVVWHEVPADHSRAERDRDGQHKLFRDAAAGLSAAASSRRDSLAARIAKAAEIRASLPGGDHCLFWHDLEAEREALEEAIPDIVTITGDGMTLERREALLVDFEEGRTKNFGTKPILSGLGSNFQYHCADMIFVGMPGDGYKFELFYQALKRLQRYGQTRPVTAHVIYSEDQREGRAALLQKWGQDREMRERMSAIIKRHGLDTLPLRDALARTIGVKRVEVRGERFIAVNNDTVDEARRWADNSVDLMVTSIPFKNKYEYAERYEDFGHVDDSAHFWAQMAFLTSELYRMLKPGRLFCCHVKDEVEFGAVTGQGVPTIDPLAAEAIMHYRAHGFQYCGEIVILTDVVTENSGTYRLGWSKNAEDSTTMGVGCPEKVLLLRKPQSDRSKGWADTRVTKQKPLCEGEDGSLPYDRKLPIVPGTGYSRARWQIDAHAFWRSSGNRLLAIEELLALGPERSSKLFPEATLNAIYDYEAHVAIGEELERRGRLPTQFMCLAPGSWHPDVWHDISRMRTLNMYQAAKGREKHVCPLQFETVDRLISRFSNPGELVYDPFGGIMTVPFRAILKGRRGAAVELESKYFLDGVHYLHLAEEKITTPALFDLAAFDAANTPQDLAEADE